MNLQFKSLQVSNVAYYKEATLDLDYKGITILRGLNLNSVPPQGNAAGKTTLASALAHVRYGGSPVADGRQNKHSLLTDSNSSITLGLQIGDHRWDITKGRKGQSVKWGLFKDGEDQEPRTAPIAEQMVQQLIPLNEEEFYTTVYLDSRRMSVLQLGTAAKRHHYFTDLFRLYDFERIKKYFSDELADLTSYAVERDALLENLESVAWTSQYDIGASYAKQNADKKERSELRQRIKELGAQKELLTLHQKFAHRVEDADKYKEEVYQSAKAVLDQWATYGAQMPQYNRYEKQKKKYESEINKARKLLDLSSEVAESESESDLRKQVDRKIRGLIEAEAVYKSQLREYEDAQTELATLSKRKAEHTKLKASLDDDLDYDKLAVKHETLSDKRHHLEVHAQSGGVCDACGSELDAKGAQRELRKLDKELEALEIELEKAEQQQKTKERLSRLWSRDSGSRMRKLSKVSKPKKVDTRLVQQLESLDLRRPNRVSKPKQPSVAKVKAEAQLEQQQKYKKAYDMVSSVRTEIEEAETSIKSGLTESRITKQVRQLSRRLERISTDLGSRTTEIERYQEDHKRYLKVAKRIRGLATKLADRDILEALMEAYGTKGIKVLVMQNLAQRIATNLNTWAPLVFTEPMTFEVIVDINVFDLIVTRKDGKKSDIRELSGAEYRQFSLLWMVAVLPLIPNDRRANLLILDEAEAGLSEVARRLLLREFLPKLSAIVPHIIFISPNDLPPGPDRRVLVAVKKGKESRLLPLEQCKKYLDKL